MSDTSLLSSLVTTRTTGYVVPVGNGAVGKSCLAIIMRDLGKLDSPFEKIARVNKSMNMEFEYISDRFLYEQRQFLVTQQFLIPPGQKDLEGDATGRSFEKVMEIYRFMIRRIDVVLLAYSITDLYSFHDLEFWVSKVEEFTTDQTHYIVVGTHLDQEHRREVTPANLVVGCDYIEQRIRQNRSQWNGYCQGLEVSNAIGTNLLSLKRAISQAILRSQGLISSITE